ncbi:hypothetical protein [Marinococcus luteus]|uniref:hypothetical protein n=1 Tax=Marinococcus luteus TaxID=1122204 RepID=UPI002ACD1491|nr:hypothetical protein [Marinococcus luteus]MDZ5783116.1 hypothetical protein [Marinococcus luteus]
MLKLGTNIFFVRRGYLMFKNDKVNVVCNILGAIITLGMVTSILYPTLEGFIPWLIYSLIVLGFVWFFIKQFYRWKNAQEN